MRYILRKIRENGKHHLGEFGPDIRKIKKNLLGNNESYRSAAPSIGAETVYTAHGKSVCSLWIEVRNIGSLRSAIYERTTLFKIQTGTMKSTSESRKIVCPFCSRSETTLTLSDIADLTREGRI